MDDFADMTFDELLKPEGHECSCGKRHATNVRYLRIGSGALAALPKALRFLKRGKPFLVSDANTYRAAGCRVEEILRSEHIPFASFRYPSDSGHVAPDSASVGDLLMAFDASCDIIVAIGSGVVNDCCKVLAHAAGKPSMVVCTAPSMDGYASSSASMIFNRIKTSLSCSSPAAILADIDILAKAPARMMIAGIGDMLAKYNALCEWRISHIVTGEPFCENIASLVRKSVRNVVDSADGILSRSPEAAGAVAEGLILSGIAMDFAKCSRPASGLEHYFSHMWEMEALRENRDCDLHGIQVGVGLCLTLGLMDKIRTLTPDRQRAERAIRDFSGKAWESEMRDVFGPASAGIIAGEREKWHKNDPALHAKRLDAIISGWDEILRAIAEEEPDTCSIVRLMKKLGLPTAAEELGLDRAAVRRAFIGSREIRDKYLVSSLLWDMGLLHEVCC